ncbi:MAG TPA: hypothetical protein VLA72_08050 [Anaerolineales bacterium]|nr:hypothetical protein [Anaerolineales bacterium]
MVISLIGVSALAKEMADGLNLNLEQVGFIWGAALYLALPF